MAPTTTMESGQMSRISSRNGTRRSRLAIKPAQPQKNCGDVAIMTSGFFSRSSDSNAALHI